MKLVLVRPNYNSHIITPPIGIGYLSAYLKKNNIKVKIIDGLRNNISFDRLTKTILDEKPDLVGITCLTAFYNETVQLSKFLKNKGIKVIIGGIHPTVLPEQTLTDSTADFVLAGEGEKALLGLVDQKLLNTGINGVYSLDNLRKEQAIRKADIIENLDDIPFPDWEQINPNTYPFAPHGAIVSDYPIGVITTSRGCPYECIFCASPLFYGRKIRFRSPENVIDEIEYLIKDFGVKEIHFEDDNLTLKRDHIEKICNLILKKKIKIHWACPNGIRADKVDEDLIKLMKKSGCYYFAYGIESANPEILRKTKKHETIEQIEQSIKLASKHGIQCQGFFIFGLPGETQETIKQTIDFAKKTPLSRAQFLILDVLPGSELWNELSGSFKPNWGKNSYKEPEWIPKGLTAQDLINAQSSALKQFYLRLHTFLRLAKSIRLKQLRFLFQRLKEYRIT